MRVWTQVLGWLSVRYTTQMEKLKMKNIQEPPAIMSPPQLYVQAGVVLETLDSVLADQGMMVPLDLGAKVLKIC